VSITGSPASYGGDGSTKQLVTRQELEGDYQNFSAAGLALIHDCRRYWKLLEDYAVRGGCGDAGDGCVGSHGHIAQPRAAGGEAIAGRVEQPNQGPRSESEDVIAEKDTPTPGQVAQLARLECCYENHRLAGALRGAGRG
jgi:hypothetical protein